MSTRTHVRKITEFDTYAYHAENWPMISASSTTISSLLFVGFLSLTFHSLASTVCEQSTYWRRFKVIHEAVGERSMSSAMLFSKLPGTFQCFRGAGIDDAVMSF